MKNLICKIFGHSPKIEGNEYKFLHTNNMTATFRCKRCNCRLFGLRQWGELSKQHIWTYVEISEEKETIK